MDSDQQHTTTSETAWLVIRPATIFVGASSPLLREQAKTWALVLDSCGIECCLEQHHDSYAITVPPHLFERACRELAEYERNNHNWPPHPPPPRPLVENTLATLSVLLLLACFHNIVQLESLTIGAHSPQWLEHGSAQAGKILDGQWWRLVTALTLHADWGHLAANLGIGGIFILLLCRELGTGLAWSLLLAAGAGGNLMNAWVQPISHHSVGASTAVFGAVGLLGSINFVRHRLERRKRWMLPVAAALSLLAILGTEGKNTDLGAHLFGFLAGVLLGAAAEYLINRYGAPGRLLGALLALMSLGVVVSSWWLALTAS